MPADQDLVEALQQGEPEAFETLVADHGAMLYRVCARIVGRADAEEVLQETLITVFQKIQSFNGDSALTTWLYRVATNTALMKARRKSSVREQSLSLPQPEYDDKGTAQREVADWRLAPEDTLLREEARQLLLQAIEKLPENYRVVYILAEIEGLPRQEIAEMLSITTTTAKTRLHRARLALREVLESYFSEKHARHTP